MWCLEGMWIGKMMPMYDASALAMCGLVVQMRLCPFYLILIYKTHNVSKTKQELVNLNKFVAKVVRDDETT